jgi:competence protein ComEC
VARCSTRPLTLASRFTSSNSLTRARFAASAIECRTGRIEGTCFASMPSVPNAFVYPALALSAGVLIALGLDIRLLAALAALALCIALSIVSLRRGWTLALLVASCAGWCCGGMALAAAADQRARDPPLRRLLTRLAATGDGPVVCVGRLASDASVVPAGVSMRVSVSRLERRGIGWPVTGDVLLTVVGTTAVKAAAEWRGGRPVRVSATLREPGGYRDPGVPDMTLALARRGVALTGTVKSAALVEVGRGTRLAEAAAAWRAWMRRTVGTIVGVWSPRSAALVLAVILGDRAGLDADDERRLQEAGTYHVIAISGGNIAILTGLLLVVGQVARVAWRLRYLAASAALVVYALAIEGGTSVTRATIMAVSYLVARSLDQESSAATAIAIALAVTVCTSPLSIVEPGFLLTFGATIALVIWAGLRIGVRLAGGWLGRHAGQLLAATLAVEAVLLPIAAWFFSRVTVAGLLLNFAAIPLMAVVQIGGMAAVTISTLHARAGVIAAWVPHQAAQLLLGSSGLVTWWPWLTWRIPSPAPWTIAAYYGVLVALVLRRWSRPMSPAAVPVAVVAIASRPRADVDRVLAAAALVLLGWIALVPHAAIGPPPSRVVRVTMIDVGQGDATLVQLPSGRALLVDAGGVGPFSRFDIADRVIAPALWALGVLRLDTVIVSHGDADHAGGIPGAAAIFAPREIWEGVPVPRDEARARLLAQADAQRVAWRAVQPGDGWRDGDVTIAVWRPPPPDWERQRVRNEDSVVLEIRYGQVSIVLPGDIGAATERLLLAMPRAALRVLKVPHHGSGGSSSLPFLQALAPNVAVISCGIGNRFGHPASAVLDRLASVGASVYRTDREGAITIETDGRFLRVTPFVSRPAFVIESPPRHRGRTLHDAVRGWITRTQT